MTTVDASTTASIFPLRIASWVQVTKTDLCPQYCIDLDLKTIAIKDKSNASISYFHENLSNSNLKVFNFSNEFHVHECIPLLIQYLNVPSKSIFTDSCMNR